MHPIHIYPDVYPEQLIAIVHDEIKRAEQESAARDAARRRRRRRRAERRARMSHWWGR